MKKIYLTPVLEIEYVAPVQVICTSDSIPGGGDGDGKPAETKRFDDAATDNSFTNTESFSF